MRSHLLRLAVFLVAVKWSRGDDAEGSAEEIGADRSELTAGIPLVPGMEEAQTDHHSSPASGTTDLDGSRNHARAQNAQGGPGAELSSHLQVLLSEFDAMLKAEEADDVFDKILLDQVDDLLAEEQQDADFLDELTAHVEGARELQDMADLIGLGDALPNHDDSDDDGSLVSELPFLDEM